MLGMSYLAALPNALLSAVSSALYALLAFAWLATAQPRAALLRRGQSLSAILAYGALQLLVSFFLSTVLYAALYAAFVPAAEAVHELHFGLCQRPPPAAKGGAPTPLPARVARLTFTDDASALLASASGGGAAGAAAAVAAGSIVPPLVRAYEYAVDMCLRLPETPSNIDVGTFLASMRVASARNQSLLAVDRQLVLRYRSERVRAMWSYAFALPLLLGWVDEYQDACLTLTEGFLNLRHDPARRATLALVSPHACKLQLYAATLTFRARLSGLTYLMTAYSFTAASVGIGGLMLLHWVALLLYELRPVAEAEAKAPPPATERPVPAPPPPPLAPRAAPRAIFNTDDGDDGLGNDDDECSGDELDFRSEDGSYARGFDDGRGGPRGDSPFYPFDMPPARGDERLRYRRGR